MKKRPIFYVLALFSILCGFFLLKHVSFAQEQEPVGALEVTSDTQDGQKTIQAILKEAKSAPNLSEYVQLWENMADDEFVIFYDGGFFGSPAESKEDFYQKALDFDNGQGLDFRIEDIASIKEIKAALQTLR